MTPLDKLSSGSAAERRNSFPGTNFASLARLQPGYKSGEVDFDPAS
jgi:hypothetical protein